MFAMTVFLNNPLIKISKNNESLIKSNNFYVFIDSYSALSHPDNVPILISHYEYGKSG